MAYISALLLVVSELCCDGLLTLIVLNMLNYESVFMDGVYYFLLALLRTKAVLNLLLGHWFYLS